MAPLFDCGAAYWNTKKIKEYIANQLREDQLSQQMTLEDFDPFKV